MNKRYTAASMKGGRHYAPIKDRPDPDSNRGRLYDWFLNNPLTPIHHKDMEIRAGFSPDKHNGGMTQLKEVLLQYGLDIRIYKRGWWWLVATDERDYLAERAKDFVE